jgi:lauroyl/myristoyl acyltransferase
MPVSVPVLSADAHIQQRPLSAKTRMMDVLRLFIERIPTPLGNFLADRLGDIVYMYAARSRRHAISNMAHVLGPGASRKELKRAVHGIFHNVMRNYFDLCRASNMKDSEIDRLVDFDEKGWERVVALQKEGRGVILATLHFGSFDIMTQVITRRGLPVSTIISRVKPAWLSDFISSLRGARGLELLLVDEEEGVGLNFGALKKSVNILRKGGMLGVASDRNLEAQGVTLRFFGKDTVVAPGVAKMALRTRAAIIPSICLRLPKNRYSLIFKDPIEPVGSSADDDAVKAILSSIFSCFEYYIRRYPEQWVLLQSVWRD